MTRLATFFLGDRRFGLDVALVREIVRHGETTPVPLAPRGVVGLWNLRGEILPAVDPGPALGLGARGDPSPGMILETRHGVLSLLIDRVGDVLEVDDTAFEPPPDTLAPAARGLVTGAWKLGQGLVARLDVEALLDAR